MLREPVIVKTATIDLRGELFVGADGLPELEVRYREDHIGLPLWEHFRPATFPAAWTVRNRNGTLEGTLLEAWNAITYLQDRLACPQREADTDDRDRAQQRESDDIEAYKRDAETKGER